MLYLLVAVDVQLLTKGDLTDQNDLACLPTVWIVHGLITAVANGFVESVCEVNAVAEKTGASVLAVDNLHSFCEDANKVLNRRAMEE